MYVYLINTYAKSTKCVFGATYLSEIEEWLKNNNMEKYIGDSCYLDSIGKFYWVGRYDTMQDTRLIYILNMSKK